MKTFATTAATLLCATALVGCASTVPAVADTPRHSMQPDLSNWSRDEARIARVEAQALRRGVAVQWVNVPMKRKPTAEPAQ